MTVVPTWTVEPTAKPQWLLKMPQPPQDHPTGPVSARETQTVIGLAIATVRIPNRTWIYISAFCQLIHGNCIFWRFSFCSSLVSLASLEHLPWIILPGSWTQTSLCGLFTTFCLMHWAARLTLKSHLKTQKDLHFQDGSLSRPKIRGCWCWSDNWLSNEKNSEMRWPCAQSIRASCFYEPGWKGIRIYYVCTAYSPVH